MDNGADNYRRFLAGDECAFDEIMKDYFDCLIFFINRYLHDIHASEDIAIDVFSDLIVHRRRYNFKVSLKTYLFMLARCRALYYIKRQKRCLTVALGQAEIWTDEKEQLEEKILVNEQKRSVYAALALLPHSMRTAVHLVYFENLSYDECACIMRKNRKQVDNLLYRAKNELRTILGKELL